MSSYDLFAPLYDLEHADLADDIGMYLNFAARCDGPVLELGCGSGRVSVALAKAGYDVTGIDESAAMLALAREHAADAGVADRVLLQQYDVRRFTVAERPQGAPRFALAIYPLNGFLHLTSGDDQRTALGNIHQALMPGGLLVVDLPNPHTTLVPGLDGQMILRRRFWSPEGHTWLSMTSTQTDLADQVQHLLLAYERVDDEGIVHRIATEMDLRFVYCYEMEYLLSQAGLKLDDVYGNYELEPYEGDSPNMVFVAFK
jgi:SAM-dependent methyltransferase